MARPEHAVWAFLRSPSSGKFCKLGPSRKPLRRLPNRLKQSHLLVAARIWDRTATKFCSSFRPIVAIRVLPMAPDVGGCPREVGLVASSGLALTLITEGYGGRQPCLTFLEQRKLSPEEEILSYQGSARGNERPDDCQQSRILQELAYRGRIIWMSGLCSVAIRRN